MKAVVIKLHISDNGHGKCFKQLNCYIITMTYIFNQ